VLPQQLYPSVVLDGRQTRDIIADAQRVVLTTNAPPALFRRGPDIARVVREDDVTRIRPVGAEVMFGRLVRVADWQRLTAGGDKVACYPPREVVRDLLANPPDGLPPLDCIVECPVFDAEGNLLATPGYHPSARVYYAPAPAFVVLDVPDVPTWVEVRRAVRFVYHEVLYDFGFQAESDRANALGLLVTPLVRPHIRGCTPPFVVEAPQEGTGKGLLVVVVVLTITGRAVAVTTIPRGEAEVKRTITSLLVPGPQFVLWDNADEPIDSASFAAVLTAETWIDREIGSSRLVEAPNRAVWVCTANNPVLSGEIERRAVRIRVLPGSEKPHEETDFRHPRLKEWVTEHRDQILHALLVLVQNWVANGMPLGSKTLGSFESWAGVVSGILEAAGIEGFLDNSDAGWEDADEAGRPWRRFVPVWWTAHGDAKVSASDLIRTAGFVKGGAPAYLAEVIAKAKTAHAATVLVALALKKVQDRVFDRYRITVHYDGHLGTKSYALEPVA